MFAVAAFVCVFGIVSFSHVRRRSTRRDHAAHLGNARLQRAGDRIPRSRIFSVFDIVARGAFAREMSTRSPVASWSRSLLPRNRGTFAPISQSSRNRSDKNASARFQTVDAARARRVRRERRACRLRQENAPAVPIRHRTSRRVQRADGSWRGGWRVESARFGKWLPNALWKDNRAPADSWRARF